VINTKNISVSQGLVVMRATEELDRGATHDEILAKVEEWIAKTRLYVDIATLKYLVRGGRLSPMKGLLARLLHLKPIITLDKDGKAHAFGKSFGRKANMKRILALIRKMAGKGKIWRYAIVHAQNPSRAQAYAAKLEPMLGEPPAYIMDVSPVVGAHNGIGVVGIALMHE
ncbi:MAG: DegV family protein, partial [Acidobacteriota bacterium]